MVSWSEFDKLYQLKSYQIRLDHAAATGKDQLLVGTLVDYCTSITSFGQKHFDLIQDRFVFAGESSQLEMLAWVESNLS